jgi:hypothetical protein
MEAWAVLEPQPLVIAERCAVCVHFIRRTQAVFVKTTVMISNVSSTTCILPPQHNITELVGLQQKPCNGQAARSIAVAHFTHSASEWL